MAFGENRVQRMVIWGSGMTGTLPAIRGGWSWIVASVADVHPDAPLKELQIRMRQEEGRLAEDLCAAGYLTIVDGPLNLVRSRDMPVVGFVRTHHRFARPRALQADPEAGSRAAFVAFPARCGPIFGREQMDLFRYRDRQVSERAVRDGASRMEERPDWMRDGEKAALLEGDRDLEVVGESFYQDNLWRLAAVCRGESVRVEITAVLVAEDGNPYDSNAIAVWIDGLKVGHLSRENACAYRPGLLALQRVHRMPIALTGVIVGGGWHDDRQGQLGVFLRHDPEDFGLRPSPFPAPEPTARTGPADALASEAGVASGAVAWGLSEADLEDARLTYVTNYNHRFMNCGRGSAEITAVVGTSRFQESLRRAATRPRPWRHAADRHLPAVLAQPTDEAGPVAVLIDGLVVGYLSHDVADRHREQLDELRRVGHHLVCSALIVGSEAGKMYGVRLQVKPGLGTRWAADAKPPVL